MQIKLTPLSPVHIGTDNSKIISPFSDYFVDEENRVACYIDHSKLDKFLESQDERVITNFVDAIRNQNSSAGKKYTIDKFLRRHGKNPYDYVLKQVPVSDFKEIKSQQINPTIKNAGQPYISGSTIKGAIRNALLFDKLLRDKACKSDLEKQINKCKDQKELENIEKEFNHKIFGKFGDDMMKFLRVSDTTCFSDNSLKVYHSKRVNIKSGKDAIPMNYEAIIPNQKSVTFEIKSSAKEIHKKEYSKLNNDEFSYLCEGNEEEIFKILRNFSESFISHEKAALEKSNSEESRHITKSLLNFLNFIVSKNYNIKGAVIFLGRGKSFFNSTIDMCFGDEVIEKIRKKAKLGINRKIKKLNNLFPTTRTVYYENGQIRGMFGWAKISKVDN